VTEDVLAGGSVIAAAAIALFFLRFWTDTGDRFFALFALAFAIFALNRIALSVLDDESEGRTLVYVARAAAFAVIIAAIVDKNRPRSA
jgi:4-hydroxybenzoate polyprenyltransferase